MTILDSFTDRIGQEVKIGDVVIYPRMNGQSPELTLAKIVSIKEKIEWHTQKTLVVRIRSIKENSWGIKDRYPNARVVITGYEASLTRHADNLIKIDDNKLTNLEYDVLIKDMEIPVDIDEFGNPYTNNKYTEKEIKLITGEWMWGY